ncbi:MAG: hypothetical protein ACYCOU_09600, partial [Sulfobacillus sp.]
MKYVYPGSRCQELLLYRNFFPKLKIEDDRPQNESLENIFLRRTMVSKINKYSILTRAQDALLDKLVDGYATIRDKVEELHEICKLIGPDEPLITPILPELKTVPTLAPAPISEGISPKGSAPSEQEPFASCSEFACDFADFSHDSGSGSNADANANAGALQNCGSAKFAVLDSQFSLIYCHFFEMAKVIENVLAKELPAEFSLVMHLSAEEANCLTRSGRLDRYFGGLNEIRESAEMWLSDFRRQRLEEQVKEFLSSRYEVTDDVRQRIKAGALLDLIKDSFPSVTTVQLSEVLWHMKLRKRRYGDGIYWYGLVPKQLPPRNFFQTAKEIRHSDAISLEQRATRATTDSSADAACPEFPHTEPTILSDIGDSPAVTIEQLAGPVNAIVVGESPLIDRLRRWLSNKSQSYFHFPTDKISLQTLRHCVKPVCIVVEDYCDSKMQVSLRHAIMNGK